MAYSDAEIEMFEKLGLGEFLNDDRVSWDTLYRSAIEIVFIREIDATPAARALRRVWIGLHRGSIHRGTAIFDMLIINELAKEV